MNRSFSLSLALRYLKPKRTFVSIITLISITGVLLGVGVLTVVVSVMSGFEREIKKTFLGFEAHVVVANQFLDDPDDPDTVLWQDLADRLRVVDGVISASPYVGGQVLLEFDHRRRAPVMRGVAEDDEAQLKQLGELVVSGKVDLDGDKAIISKSIARQLGIFVGDTVTLYSPKNVEQVLDAVREAENDPEIREKRGAITDRVNQLIAPASAEVTAIINSPMYTDQIIIPLFLGQELYQMGGEVHGIGLLTEDPYKAAEVMKRANAVKPSSWISYTWMKKNEIRFKAIRLERQLISFLLFFIILVAAFSIMNTMITVTVQKRGEIGIMKAIGARVSQIVMVFVSQGMIVGSLGTLSGLAFGGLVLRYRNVLRRWLEDTFHIPVLPESVYGIGELPARVIPSHIIAIAVGAFVLCTLAALPPAYFVARMDAARALRSE